MSHVTRHISCVICHNIYFGFSFRTKGIIYLLEGPLSTWPTLSSFIHNSHFHTKIYHRYCLNLKAIEQRPPYPRNKIISSLNHKVHYVFLLFNISFVRELIYIYTGIMSYFEISRDNFQRTQLQQFDLHWWRSRNPPSKKLKHVIELNSIADIEFGTNFTRKYVSRKSFTPKCRLNYNYLGQEENIKFLLCYLNILLYTCLYLWP